MKYKPNYDCITNRCGQMPVGWVRGADATPQKIMEQLYSVTGGDGYKFVTIYDCTKEYEVPEKEDRAWQIAGETDNRKEAQYLRWYMNTRGYIARIERI